MSVYPDVSKFFYSEFSPCCHQDFLRSIEQRGKRRFSSRHLCYGGGGALAILCTTHHIPWHIRWLSLTWLLWLHFTVGLNGLTFYGWKEKKFNYLAGYFFPFSFLVLSPAAAGNDNDGHGFSSSLRGRLKTSENIIYFRVLLSISSHSCRSLLRYGFLVFSSFWLHQQKMGTFCIECIHPLYSPNLLVSLLLSATCFHLELL